MKELNNRLKIETEKAFAAKFSHRVQESDETAEEFAAELKRLYAKVYKNRDSKTRQEDLVRMFLDGSKDHEAHFESEFMRNQMTFTRLCTMQSTSFRQKEEIHMRLKVRGVLRNLQGEPAKNVIAKRLTMIHLKLRKRIIMLT